MAGCKQVPSKKRGLKESLVVSSHVQIMQNVREERAGLRSLKFMVSYPRLRSFKSFKNLEQEALWLDDRRQEVVRLPLVDYHLAGKFSRLSLVLSGCPGWGKTAFTRTLAAAIARANTPEGEDPDQAWFIFAKTLVGITSVRAYVRAGVPVIYDELKPGAK